MTGYSSRIVITGASAISSAGTGLSVYAEAVRAGISTLSQVPEDLAGIGSYKWGRANHFKAVDHIPPLKARKLDRASQFAVSVAGLALADATIEKGVIAPERIGIALGCGFGGISNSAEFLTGYFQGGQAGLAPMLFPNTVANAAASNASIEFGLKGPNITFIQRFCSAESAVMAACRFIDEGRADVMLAGGVDDLSPLMLKGFMATGQIRRFAEGFGEGSGMLVLERHEHAVARKARVMAEIESFSTVGRLSPGDEQAGWKRLMDGVTSCDVATLSGAEQIAEQIFSGISAVSVYKPGLLVGRSLAMGGVVLGFLANELGAGMKGVHLAASPEGPYYAVRLKGFNPAQQ